MRSQDVREHISALHGVAEVQDADVRSDVGPVNSITFPRQRFGPATPKISQESDPSKPPVWSLSIDTHDPRALEHCLPPFR